MEKNLSSICSKLSSQPNVAYDPILIALRTDVELYYTSTTAFYESIATQNIDSNSIPILSWTNETIVCQLNSTLFIQVQTYYQDLPIALSLLDKVPI
jgi:hypothetical protein